MGKKTTIAWTKSTWNPWTGCHKVSSGCAHCYMFTQQQRYGRDPQQVVRTSDRTFNSPLRWKESQTVFTCSWSDYFLEEADGWRADAWDIIRRTPHHTYQILTKRPERIAEHLPADWGAGWPNVWLGISAENQAAADLRIPLLLEVPAAIRFASCEPLLGPITGDLITKLDWVIVGGESGPKHRPMDMAWARAIRDQCVAADIPFFFKQQPGRVPGHEPFIVEVDGSHTHWQQAPTITITPTQPDPAQLTLLDVPADPAPDTDQPEPGPEQMSELGIPAAYHDMLATMILSSLHTREQRQQTIVNAVRCRAEDAQKTTIVSVLIWLIEQQRVQFDTTLGTYSLTRRERLDRVLRSSIDYIKDTVKNYPSSDIAVLLELERGRAKPRKTLIAFLTGLLPDEQPEAAENCSELVEALLHLLRRGAGENSHEYAEAIDLLRAYGIEIEAGLLVNKLSALTTLCLAAENTQLRVENNGWGEHVAFIEAQLAQTIKKHNNAIRVIKRLRAERKAAEATA